MPISTDDILQTASGTLDGDVGSSVTITFPATTAGSSSVVIVGMTGLNSDSGGANFNFPAGGAGSFTPIHADDSGGTARSRHRIFVQRKVAAGENSWTMSLAGTAAGTLSAWFAFEIPTAGNDIPTNLGANESFKRCSTTGAGAVSATTVASDESGFVPATANTVTDAYEHLGLALFCANNPATTAPTFSSFGLEGYAMELQEYAVVSLVGSAHAISMAICLPAIPDIGRFRVSASVSPNSYMASDFVTFYGDGSKYSAKYEVISGAETGTGDGLTSGSIAVAGTAPLDFSAGSPEVVSNIKRTGTYGYKLSATSAVENFGWNTAGALGVYFPTSPGVGVARGHVYFDTLPSGDCEIAFFKTDGSLSNGARLWYRAASGKLAVKIGSGSDVLSDAAIAADKHIGYDLRYVTRSDAGVTTTHVVDWQVDYDSLDATGPVAQTRATQTGMTAGSVTDFGVGWNDATTAECYVDDLVYSKQWGSYPIGDVRIAAVKVDPAGTITVSGTSSNFGVISGGSVGAWNATNARNAIDEIPPVQGGSADGIAMVAVAASDYVEIPMDTFTAAPDNCIRAGRWYVPGWAVSGNPGTFRLLSNDGTVDVFDVAVNDHGFDDTAMRWLCGMQRRKVAGSPEHYLFTQTLLDALALRFGYSTDANPDVGILAVIFEVAYQPAIVYGTAEAEDGAFKLYVRQDPVSGAVISYLATTPSGTRGATFTATVNGTPITPVAVDPNTALEVLSVGASSISEVTSVGYEPDPSE